MAGVLGRVVAGFGRGLVQKAAIDWEQIKEESRAEQERALREIDQKFRTEESAKEREFRAGESAKEQALRIELNQSDNAAADRRAGAQLAASREDRAAAREDAREARVMTAQERRIEKEMDREDKRQDRDRYGGYDAVTVKANYDILRDPDALDSDRESARKVLADVTRAQQNANKPRYSGEPMMSKNQPENRPVMPAGAPPGTKYDSARGIWVYRDPVTGKISQVAD